MIYYNCQISIDGSWKKRGYASLNGIVTGASELGKVLDLHVMFKFCKSCAIWENRKQRPQYKKSSGAMEAAGAIAMFQSSLEK